MSGFVWLTIISPISNVSPSVVAFRTLPVPLLPANVQGETLKALDRAALDPDCCRIICAGWQGPLDAEPQIRICTTDQQEIETLTTLWERRIELVDAMWQAPPFLGYGLTWFDLGVMVRRSQILGVSVPEAIYKQGKYRHDLIIELADYLTMNGMIDQKKGRGLEYQCRRLGITVPDDYTGKDVGQLWKDGNVQGIRDHCQADLTRIRLLAERLGVISSQPIIQAPMPSWDNIPLVKDL